MIIIKLYFIINEFRVDVIIIMYDQGKEVMQIQVYIVIGFMFLFLLVGMIGNVLVFYVFVWYKNKLIFIIFILILVGVDFVMCCVMIFFIIVIEVVKF